MPASDQSGGFLGEDADDEVAAALPVTEPA